MTNDDKWAQAYAEITLRFNSLVDRVDALAEENERLRAVAEDTLNFIKDVPPPLGSARWHLWARVMRALSAAGYVSGEGEKNDE